MTRLHRLLLVTCGLMVIGAGCSSRPERLYRRAEAFLAQGQFEMAAEEYRRLVREHPRSELADDALYKLAYVNAEELGRPSAALLQYRAIIDRYPSSPYVDDAMMRVMAIQRKVLRDPAAVRQTWDEMRERFGDRRGLCARGLLEVAQAHFENEDYQRAAEVARELIESYGDQVRQSAQAALLRARAIERRGAEPAEVEELYEQVIAQYPDTHSAAMAKRSIGWIYYGKREEQEQQQAEVMRQRSRVIEGVPAHSDGNGQMMQALAALRSLLTQRGEARPLEHIAALSGTVFVMVFDPQRPNLARSVLDDSPFEIVANLLGFAHNTWSGSNPETAFETVHHALLQGHPVLVRYGSPARWIVVTGYEMAGPRVHLMPPNRRDYETAGRETFMARWREGSASGSGVAGSEPFHQFSLGTRLNTPTEEQILKAVVLRAALIMQQTSMGGAPAGAAAWEATAAWLENCTDPDAEALRSQVVTWARDGLSPQLAVAQKGTPLLTRTENLHPELENAGERFAELLREARLAVRKVEEAADDSAQDVEAEEPQDPALKWEAAAAQARYVAALHARLAEQFATAAAHLN